MVSGTVRINQSVLPSLTIGWLHRRGPAQDGFSRPHRITTAVTGSWSNPAFADGDRAVFTVGGQLGYAWDTRVSALFPQRGRRLSVFVDGGVAPGADTWWSAGYLTGTQLVAVHPRVVLAGRARAAVARGTTTQRLLWLGGSGSGVSLKPGIAIGTERAGLEAEVRWAALRDLSVPLVGLAWLSQVQLSAGGEAVGLRTLDGQGAGVVGLTGGASFVADLLGAKPGLGGITLGVPAVVRGVVDEDGGAVRAWDSVQITVRFAQAW